MIVIPAIDLKEGKVVRLLRGKVSDMTVYSEDPIAVAKKWEAAGAEILHVVDLDGAIDGVSRNFDLITKIAASVKIPVQLGGGIRNKYDVARYLTSGVSRVIVGTKAVQNISFLKEIVAEWHGQIIVSADCHNGLVALHGWTEVSTLKAVDFAKEIASIGVKCLVYTDISRDGTLGGPNLEGLKEILNNVTISVIASGGVSSLEDIKDLLKLESQGLWGVITGKAIYEGKLDLAQAIKLCSPKG